MNWQRPTRLAVLLGVVVCLAVGMGPAAWSGANAQQKTEEQAQKDSKEAEKEEPKEEKEEAMTEADKAKQEEMEKKACESLDTHYKTDTDKTKHPTPEPPTDKALIYVVRPTMGGHKVQTKLAMDGQFKGINRGNNYFFFTVEPGLHYFCSQAENKSTLSLQVEAGKTYYLQQKIKMGFFKARNKLVVINEAEGKEALGKTHPSSWEEKK